MFYKIEPEGNEIMIKSIPLRRVEVEDEFWNKYKSIVANEVIPYQWKALNDELPNTEPSHAIENFRIVAGESNGEFYGTVFQDSDVAKWLETVAYSLLDYPNRELEERADELISLLGRAQAEDGYLNSYYMLKEPDNRWTNLRDNHELYCAGHFIEAAVAYFETTGKTEFLRIVEKNADLIDRIFGPEEDKLKGYPGHEEIELALLRLYDVTEKEKYLKLAQYFIEIRGQQPIYFEEEMEKRKVIETVPTWNSDDNVNFGLGYEYQQAHKPVRDQTEAVGHAVRAVYLYTAMADLAAKTDDTSLKKTCEILWDDVTNHKMYITAGIGSNVIGEAFTSKYDLPNDSMYCETCASVGLVFWANRMLRIDADRRYADVLERAIYNGTISGMDLDGKRFFYVNPLEVNSAQAYRKEQQHVKSERQKWFFCACCPPNLARMIASVENNIYTQSEDTLYTHLYIGGKVKTTFHKSNVEINQTHQYPWQGSINFTINVSEPVEYRIALRIPGWCQDAEVEVNGKNVSLSNLEKGYLILKKVWEQGDKISVRLEMPVIKVRSNPYVSTNQGQIALQRGPVVYCIEEFDNGPNLAGIRIPKKGEFICQSNSHVLSGIPLLLADAYRIAPSAQLYCFSKEELISQKIIAIPYYAWCNRNKGEMRVWIYEE